MTAALEVRSLTKRFHSVAALDDVSLTVQPGEFIALLGPSGSGKTTLLRLLAGFELPTTGEIVIEGRNVVGLAPGDRNIGMVFQHYALFPHMSVARNIEYGLRMHGWAPARRKARVEELLTMIRLDQFGSRLPNQLSGGQQQRVAIARALAYSPSLLLMDEPLGALDRALRMEMTEEIRRIHRALGATFIYVTHDREEAMTLADRVLVMRHGRVDADGSPQELFERPGTAFVAGFFAGMNVLSGSVLGLDDRPVAIAPSAIAFTPPPEEHHLVTGTVRDMLFLGQHRTLLIDVEGRSESLRAQCAASAISPEIGATVQAFVRRSDLLILP